MRNILFFALIFLLSCHSIPPKNEKARAPAYAENAARIFKHEKLTFDKFLRLIDRSNARTVEDALRVLKGRYAPYMTLHTLMYDSFSLQGSSFAEPRVIVFGPDADFIFTFNGSTRQSRGFAIETMEFDRSSGQFLFREVAFKAEMQSAAADDRLKKSEIDYEDPFIQVSKPNIGKCTQCHGTDPNPIWETYFLWPGAYGSNDDRLTYLFDRESRAKNYNYANLDPHEIGTSQGRDIALKAGIADVESSGLRKYLERKSKHRRFRHLPKRAVEEAFHRWNAGANPIEIDIAKELAVEIKNLGEIEGTTLPNFRLLSNLYDLVGQKVIGHLNRNPGGPKFLAKLAYIDQCIPMKPKDVIEEAQSRLYSVNDPLPYLHEVLSSDEMSRVKKVSGSWPEFLRDFLVAEAYMDSEKISRMERSFGKGSIVDDGLPARGRPPLTYFQSLGVTLPEHIELVTRLETDGSSNEALLAYVANGLGYNLDRWSLNMRRVATFRNSGLRKLYHQAGLLFDPNAPESMDENLNTDSSKVCGRIKAQALR